ncbi:aldo/keto reductase [Amycolatopsis sp. NPDC051045]|uniref:aldo/keto reductase n=1 Tax=Amycolatopsis sp. NPDC051045 TaxID=3156922 RepID=UPI00341AAEF0
MNPLALIVDYPRWAGMHLGRQGFGAMRLRDQTVGDADRDPVSVIHAALDAGITMVDTADAYRNEELVGRAIRGVVTRCCWPASSGWYGTTRSPEASTYGLIRHTCDRRARRACDDSAAGEQIADGPRATLDKIARVHRHERAFGPCR